MTTYPLDGKGHTVRPLVIVVQEATEHTGANELTNDPTQVDVRGQVGSQHRRSDIGGVCDSDGL